MAERGIRETTIVRRPSFRKSLAEADLPPEFLDRLETKRKALDESIHKYIAAKEREYKLFEKEVRAQHRTLVLGDAGVHQQRRRASEEETRAHNADEGSLSAVDALIQNGARRASDSVAGAASTAESHRDNRSPPKCDAHAVDVVREQRDSPEREKEFIGVFTPQYLPMLETRQEILARTLERERTNSAPPAVELVEDKAVLPPGSAMYRANSDTLVQAPQAEPKRPAHLQLSHRTSSSGSSVDGRLISAMKSPTEQARPKRKRVSLAVGDAIVAPSDNVPVALSNNSTPSHSRTRSSGSDRASPPKHAAAKSSGTSQPNQTGKAERIISGSLNGAAVGSLRALHEQETAAANTAQQSARQLYSPPSGDDIGELWHMEEPDVFEEPSELLGPPNDPELDEDIGPAITGRVGTSPAPASPSSPTSPLPTATAPLGSSPPSDLVPLPTTPTSATTSQQPARAGFRRPSVVRDPEYAGRDYGRGVRGAEESGVYGSSFSRPPTKGSFGAGSLGESFMARHAAEMEMGRARDREGRAR